jgi:hypothetical protein
VSKREEEISQSQLENVRRGTRGLKQIVQVFDQATPWPVPTTEGDWRCRDNAAAIDLSSQTDIDEKQR